VEPEVRRTDDQPCPSDQTLSDQKLVYLMRNLELHNEVDCPELELVEVPKVYIPIL
jgi:hypothetical protein